MRGEEIHRYLSPRLGVLARRVIFLRFEEGIDLNDITEHVELSQQRVNKIVKDFEDMIFEDGYIKRTSYQRPGQRIRLP